MLFEDYELNEDQRAMQATARRFAKEHIKPIASEIDCIVDYLEIQNLRTEESDRLLILI